MATPTLSDILGYGAPGGGDELMIIYQVLF